MFEGIGDTIDQGLNFFITNFWFFVALIIGLILFITFYKTRRKVIDYAKLFKRDIITDNRYHKTNYKWLYRGNRKIGKILSYTYSRPTKISSSITKTPLGKSKSIQRNPLGIVPTSDTRKIISITFRPKRIRWILLGKDLWLGKDYIKLYDGMAVADHKDLILPADVKLTRWVDVLAPVGSGSIMNEINTEMIEKAHKLVINSYVSNMAKLSQVTPEEAFELSKLREEARLEEAKRKRQFSLIK